MYEKESLEQKRKNEIRKRKIRKSLQTAKSDEFLELDLKVPVYETVSEVPDLERGKIVYIKEIEQLLIEDGT